ncbi:MULTISPECIES: hypothetical protein [Haloferax]|uniref:Uncharacterized protein n=1 Tax=Haloferax marinum TaxID=2666143 RepID=A0A6A8G256_9EURY|nr:MULTISPECIES: hypothetical protein [Haloferax]KAB1196187.1 hypothetical protein Hfx1150_01135 [Haloferax sp. CBA1150]MRW95174.1 hypothetical protein [Haloferax marinum]
MPSRRQVLAGAVAGLGMLAYGGNHLYQSSRPMLYLRLRNYDDEPHTVSTRLVRRDATELSEGTVFTDTTQLDARDDGEEHVPWAKVFTRAPARPYIVQVELAQDGSSEEFTFIPDCERGNYGADEPEVVIEITDSGDIRMERQWCGSDSLWF